jgi:hypothetical protein
MIIQVSDIPDDGLLIANAGEFVAPFSDRSWRLTSVRLHVSRDGEEVVVVGELGATVPLVCGRCLEEFQVDVRPRVDLRYVPRPAIDDSVDRGNGDDAGLAHEAALPGRLPWTLPHLRRQP